MADRVSKLISVARPMKIFLLLLLLHGPNNSYVYEQECEDGKQMYHESSKDEAVWNGAAMSVIIHIIQVYRLCGKSVMTHTI